MADFQNDEAQRNLKKPEHLTDLIHALVGQKVKFMQIIFTDGTNSEVADCDFSDQSVSFANDVKTIDDIEESLGRLFEQCKLSPKHLERFAELINELEKSSEGALQQVVEFESGKKLLSENQFGAASQSQKRYELKAGDTIDIYLVSLKDETIFTDE